MARPTQQEIDEWNARMNEPEGSDDDFEVEIYSPDGHGARLPYGKAKSYLQSNFGIDLDEMEKPGGNGADPNADPNGAGNVADPPGNTGGTRTTAKYFGKQGK